MSPPEPPKTAWHQALWQQIRNREPASLKLLRDAKAEAQRSRLPQMAAALSYRTIFGLIPVMVVALIALKFFTTESDLTDAINRGMQYSGLSQIAVSDSPANMGPFPEGAAAPQASSAQRLDLWIKQLVARVSDFKFGAVGVVGVVALLYAAISMMVEVERSFNQVLCVPVGRSWMRRVLNYWFLLTVGPAVLFATFFVGQRFTAAIGTTLADAGAFGKILFALVGYLSTASISTVMFLALYLAIPNTRVKFSAALTGAFVAALLWEAGKWGFTQYLRYSAGYAKLYGSIALVPLFLLWVYATWCIVLAGLNIAYYMQHGRRLRAIEPREQINPGVVDPGTTIALAAALAQQFAKGEPAAPGTLAGMSNLQEAIVVQLLDRLVGAGIAQRVRKGDEEGYYSLARPADTISAQDALVAGDGVISQPGVGTVAQAMREARLAAVRGKTIADFMDRPIQAPPDARTPVAPAPA